MAIVGGAIMPLVQGKLVDATSAAFSFIVPAGCFAVVGLYALYDLRAAPSVTGGEPVREVGPAPDPGLRNPPGARHDRPPRSRRGRRRGARADALGACGNDSPTSATTTRSNSRSCRGGPPGPRRRRSTPCSPHSASRTRASTPSTARSPGGAGSNAIVELAKRLQHDDPPDVWQTFAGKSVQGYASRGVVRSVASVFDSEDLRRDDEPHDPPLASCATASRTGSRPARTAATSCGSTRSCSRRRASTPPASGYTLAAFLADLAKVKASGALPLCLGGKDRFTTVELFENTLLSSIGTQGWKDMVGDDLDWRSDQVQTALKSFGVMLGYADPQASGLTWDQATKKLAAGGCAFESMNDSAFGELVAAGAREDQDFGSTAFPGTDKTFLAVVDVFVAATEGKERQERAGVPRRHQRARHAARVQPGQRGRSRSSATSTSRR